MRLFEELLRKISDVFPNPSIPTQRLKLLSRLNPDKFYVENVRSLLGVSTWQARQICETAVRQRVFDRLIEVQCPDGSIALEADSEEALPLTVECAYEKDGEYEVEEFTTASLKKGTFYRLHEERVS